MKLIKFKLENFKRYLDTDWITVGDLTAFIGKNESGKSALFQGLAKLNPSDKMGYDKLRDLPRKLYTDLLDTNPPAASAIFEFDSEEQSNVKRLCKIKQITNVTVTRYYDGNYAVWLPKTKKHTSGELFDYVINKMPQFIYFDNHDVLDASISIPEYLQKLNGDPENKKLRVINCLFKHVKLKLKKLQDLDPNVKGITTDQGQKLVLERSALCNSAQSCMTAEFSKWWFQRKHSFHYKIDSKFFHIEVSDDLDPNPIILEERSMGMKYFFSFYLIFLVESEDFHKNSIILLDEPGLHYHGSMQLNLIKFFKSLSKKNQLCYSTHSPFLLDSEQLDSIKTVFEDESSGYSKVTETKNWPNDNDALFPIRVGWWYDVLSSYIIDKIHLVLEGQTDVDIFNAINSICQKRSKTSLCSEILCVPGGGRNTTNLISLLRAQDIKIILFQDGDDEGKNRGKDINKQYNIPYTHTSEFMTDKTSSSIEDLFPRKFYLDAVNKVYPDLDIPLDVQNSDGMITKTLKDVFKQKEIDFEKFKITRELIKKIDELSDDELIIFENIFKKINEISQKHKHGLDNHVN